ncbi:MULTISPECIES: hydroxymethylglutaryl-CoA lyase [Bacillaceae]|uniref:Hydroxymethylglutaryl-CoA lyase n=1 Tax=Evansella alkalicola TaxID=745819 RepID=A0ABS6JQD7_9BACI|nr:hydroxymethylglutaryl-CoA lyase [Litchfieldia alkalitelluris]MBU9720755.1 hydroxymethylglutaryl-CoA lyase [Bacillus alkalicola]
MNLPSKVKIKEVGPRDGLQNEKAFIPTDTKVEWINKLSETGMDYIEVTSFVHPKWIPALADAMEVAKRIERKSSVTYAALVPNRRGLEGALEADLDEVSIFMSASETHNQQNINKSIQNTFPVLKEVVSEALSSGKKVRGYLSTVFGCPYDGRVPLSNVQKVIDELFDMGVYEVSLGDTIGVANPKQMDMVLSQLLQEFPAEKLALHLHDTRGMALANTVVGLMKGITVFDSAVGGLGGCPYAKGAAGNVATEDLIHMLKEMGIETGIDLSKVLTSAKYIERELGKGLPSKQLQIWNSAI